MEPTSSSERDRLMQSGGTPIPGLESVVDEMPISRVREGMDVVDADGKKIGEVEVVRLGDPEAITTAGQDEPGARAGLADALLGIFDDSPDLPETIRGRLIREGFIRIDGGIFGPTRYALASQIADVTGDTVRLNARADELIKK